MQTHHPPTFNYSVKIFTLLCSTHYHIIKNFKIILHTSKILKSIISQLRMIIFHTQKAINIKKISSSAYHKLFFKKELTLSHFTSKTHQSLIITINLKLFTSSKSLSIPFTSPHLLSTKYPPFNHPFKTNLSKHISLYQQPHNPPFKPLKRRAGGGKCTLLEPTPPTCRDKKAEAERSRAHFIEQNLN